MAGSRVLPAACGCFTLMHVLPGAPSGSLLAWLSAGLHGWGLPHASCCGRRRGAALTATACPASAAATPTMALSWAACSPSTLLGAASDGCSIRGCCPGC